MNSEDKANAIVGVTFIVCFAAIIIVKIIWG